MESKRQIEEPKILHRCQLVESLEIKAVILETYDQELLKALRACGLQVGVLQANGEE